MPPPCKRRLSAKPGTGAYFSKVPGPESYFLIQFLKQGPAYKKEGPDPNKGSNQLYVKL